MWTDPIIEDLHAQRRAHAAEYGFDVKRLLAALHAAQDSEASKVAAPLVQPARQTNLQHAQRAHTRSGA
jgi:hypothetical protein